MIYYFTVIFMKRKVIHIVSVLILLIYIICIVPKFFQNDTLFDIKLGEKFILKDLSTSDDFSIHENLQYTPQHFAQNILTFLIYKHFDFWGLYILCIILTSLLSILLYKTNKLFLKSKIACYIFVFWELFLLNAFISIRAQMYSYIFFLIEIICIEKFLKHKERKFLIILSILPLLIINFHAGTIWFYFIVILVYLLNYIPIKTSKIEYNTEYIHNLKYLLIPLTLGIFLIFINPFGINQILYSLKTIDNSFINMYISEFQPLTIKNGYGIYIFVYTLLLFTCILFTSKKIKLEHICFGIGTLFMALLTARHSSIFIIFSIPFLSYGEELLLKLKFWMYKGVSNKGKIILRNFAILFPISTLLLFSATYFFSIKLDYLPKSTYPIDSVEYIKTNIGNDKRIFNEYTYGSLLMFNDIKVFIDSRADLYTKEYNKDCTVAEDYIAAITCAGNYEEILTKYNIEYLLIGKDSALAHNIFNDKKYEKIFDDEISYVIKVDK